MSVQFSRSDSGYLMVAETLLPGACANLFAFFADAHNLEAITPGYLRFRIMTPAPIAMTEGALIDYRLRLRGIPIRWQTEISEWQPPYRFVDRQIRGPYRYWVHEHTLEQQGDQTLVRDRVRYAVPFGRVTHWLFVRRELTRIFQFRQTAVQRLLATPPVG